MSERLFYRKRHRIRGSDEFDAVFAYKVRKSKGPITVFVMPNGRDEHRLGLSIGKRVGNAVARGRVKRMIREAFRHEQSDIPMTNEGAGYDIVVTARAHDGAGLELWRDWFTGATKAAVRVVEKRVEDV